VLPPVDALDDVVSSGVPPVPLDTLDDIVSSGVPPAEPSPECFSTVSEQAKPWSNATGTNHWTKVFMSPLQQVMCQRKVQISKRETTSLCQSEPLAAVSTAHAHGGP
jgi:hypothetical protein